MEKQLLLSKTLQREPNPLLDTGAAKLHGESGFLGLPAHGTDGFGLFWV